MTAYEHWLLVKDPPVATLTLNRPHAMNSLTAETLYELQEIAASLSGKTDLRVIILQGQGKHFSTGIDVNLIKERLDYTEQANREFLLGLQHCLDDWEALPKPTIAKLHGFCIGGGLILALCCDFRVASQRTTFALPEIKLGIPVLMGTQRVTRLAGVGATKEMILLGERFSASAAQAVGLLHSVVPPENLDETVASLANKLTQLAPRTMGLAKKIVDAGYDLSLRSSQDLEIEALAELLPSQDIREAIASYLEKRPPHFTGE